jgi:chorismate synthase
MLRYLTAGESHGKAIVALIDGFPAGVVIDTAPIDVELRRRQGGYGRGGRQRIETDTIEILSGLWHNTTLGSPIAIEVVNKDAKLERLEDLERPRPGHADLTGAMKYLGSIRAVLERASARETTVRVAAGAIAKQLLAKFGIAVLGYVVELGGVKVESQPGTIDEHRKLRDESIIYSLNPKQDEQFKQLIDAAGKDGDTLGGVMEVRVEGLPFGLGSHTQWDRKLDGRLAQAIMSIPAIKAVGIGRGQLASSLPGSRVHDEILPPELGQREGASRLVRRPTNNAGGLEGGVTNGEDLRVSGFMKPIATLMKPLRSVDLRTLDESPAAIERSDVCAVPAAAVVAEAMVAFVLADAAVEKFGGDSMDELVAAWRGHLDRTAARFVRS